MHKGSYTNHVLLKMHHSNLYPRHHITTRLEGLGIRKGSMANHGTWLSLCQLPQRRTYTGEASFLQNGDYDKIDMMFQHETCSSTALALDNDFHAPKLHLLLHLSSRHHLRLVLTMIREAVIFFSHQYINGSSIYAAAINGCSKYNKVLLFLH